MYDPNENSVKKNEAPIRQEVLKKPPGVVQSKPNTVRSAVIYLDAAGKRRPVKRRPPQNPKEAPFRQLRRTKRRRRLPKRFRDEET